MRLVAAGDRSTTTVAGASASDSLDMWQCYASDGIMSGPMRSLVERGGVDTTMRLLCTINALVPL